MAAQGLKSSQSKQSRWTQQQQQQQWRWQRQQRAAGLRAVWPRRRSLAAPSGDARWSFHIAVQRKALLVLPPEEMGSLTQPFWVSSTDTVALENITAVLLVGYSYSAGKHCNQARLKPGEGRDFPHLVRLTEGQTVAPEPLCSEQAHRLRSVR